MRAFYQSPTEPSFVQNPYAFYDRVRSEERDFFYWEDYEIVCAHSYRAVSEILRSKSMGREAPQGLEPDKPEHQAGFWRIEDHSMLEAEPPRHTRLRGLVLKAFTSRRIAAFEPDIRKLAQDLLDQCPDTSFDLLETFANKLPVIIIARLLGVPDHMADQLLHWSHAMVAMYQAGRTRQMEIDAANSATEFHAYMSGIVAERQKSPKHDLISQLVAAEQDGHKFSRDELISNAVLLLNAGHEATVHTFGNGVYALLRQGFGSSVMRAAVLDRLIEEILRFDAPLHMFQRFVYDDTEICGAVLPKGSKVACLLGAANRDPDRWDLPNEFIPDRPIQLNASFGAGTHFCIGAPLARLELKTALPVLFENVPNLRIAEPPKYAKTYHFHGLTSLIVDRG